MSRGIFGGMFSGMGSMGYDLFFLMGQDQRKK